MNKGLAIIEIMVGTLIVGIITGIMFMALTMTDARLRTDLCVLNLQQQARQAMDGMVRELRQAKQETGKPITISGGGGQIQFYIPGISNPVRYYRSGNQIIREHPANTTKVIANKINSLSFCCWSGGACGVTCTGSLFIRIQVGATDTYRSRPFSFSITEEVRLRNE